MKKLKQILLICLIATLSSAGEVYAGSEEELMLLLNVPPTVSIEKDASSTETTSVNVETGVHTGLTSVFTLQTNGTDEDYDFIMTSTIQKDGGTSSAYGLNGENPILLFSNTNNLPADVDIENAKIGGNSNRNVIAYPVNVVVTSPMTSEFKQNYKAYGDCMVIKLNGKTFGAIIQSVSATPVNGTYIVGQDTAGTYKSTVTFTAVSKL